MSTAQNSCGLPAGRQADRSRLVLSCVTAHRGTSQHDTMLHPTKQRYGEQNFSSVPRNGAYRSMSLRSAPLHFTPRRAASHREAIQHNEKTGSIMLPVT